MNSIFLDDSFIIPQSEAVPSIATVYEGYFGKNPFVIKLIGLFDTIQTTLRERVGKTLDDQSRSSIQNYVKELENLCSEHFNVQKMCFYIDGGFSVSCVPIAMGKINLEAYQQYGSNAMDEFEKYSVNHEGIRYKHSDAKFFIVVMGVTAIAHSAFNAEHLAAVLLHEIGHSFMQYRCGYSLASQRFVKTLLYSERLFTAAIKSGVFLTQIEKAAKTPGPTGFHYLYCLYMLFFKIEHGKKQAIAIIKHQGLQGNLHYLKELACAAFSMVNLLKAIKGNMQLIHDTLFKRQDAVFTYYEKLKASILKGTFVVGDSSADEDLIKALYAQLLTITNQAFMIFMSSPISWLKGHALAIFKSLGFVKNVEELKADTIPALYGLGKEFSEALILRAKHLGSDSIVNSGIFQVTNNIPAVRVVAQMPMLLLQTMGVFAGGHPPNRVRIHNIYKTLQEEVRDPNLPPELKQALRYDLNEIAKVYNGYIDPTLQANDNNYARALIYFIMRHISKLVDPKLGGTLATGEERHYKAYEETWDEKPLFRKFLNFTKEDELDFMGIVRQALSKSPLKISQDAAIRYLVGENTTILEDEYGYNDPLDGILTVEPLTFEDRELLKGLNTITYYGKNAATTTVISYLEKIRATIKPYLNGKLSDAAKAQLKKLAKELGLMLAKTFNVSEVTIWFMEQLNACAYPLYLGRGSELKNIDSFNIISTPKGMRFKVTAETCLVLGLGLPLFIHSEFSNEQIAAILFHEIGHTFQQYKTYTSVEEKAYMWYNILPKLTNTIISIIRTAMSNLIMAIPLAILAILGNYPFFKELQKSHADRSVELKKRTEILLDEIDLKTGKLKNPMKLHGTLRFIIMLITLPLIICSLIITDLLKVIPIPGVAPALTIYLTNRHIFIDMLLYYGYIKHERNNETFADNFALSYGLGGELAEALSKITIRYREGSTTQLLGILKKIPLIKNIVAFNNLTTLEITSVMYSHPETHERLYNLYTTLEKNLGEAELLSDATRSRIKSDLNAIKTQYDYLCNRTHRAEKEQQWGVAVYWWLRSIIFKIKELQDTNNTPVTKAKAFAITCQTLTENTFIKDTLKINIMDLKAAFCKEDPTLESVMLDSYLEADAIAYFYISPQFCTKLVPAIPHSRFTVTGEEDDTTARVVVYESIEKCLQRFVAEEGVASAKAQRFHVYAIEELAEDYVKKPSEAESLFAASLAETWLLKTVHPQYLGTIRCTSFIENTTIPYAYFTKQGKQYHLTVRYAWELVK
jgi:hypothetical protein